jgi:hypothetical protein
MSTSPAKLSRSERDAIRILSRETMLEARDAGLLAGPRTEKVSGRFSRALLDRARKRAGATSNTKVLELALVKLALEDSFGVKLLKRKGTLPKDFDLEF